jgi:UDPglucose 6-dehydrogenase
VLISVLGAGYVGLVTAACLSKLGNVVRCVDANEQRIEQLKRGQLPIEEPGLAELVEAGAAAGRLTFHAEPEAVHGTSFVIVAVGTFDAVDHWTGAQVRSAVIDLARDTQAPRQIVVRSTLLPGTAAGLRDELASIDPRVELAHNPEFTREGSAVNDFLAPDRVVVGVSDATADSDLSRALGHLYQPLGAPMLVTDLTSAEMIKVCSNVFLGAKIAFANELARLCAATGADVQAVVDGMGLDRRIGRSFLSPGPGFGGSCLPSQATALPRHAESLGVHLRLIGAVAPSNEDQAVWCVEQLASELGGSLRGLNVGVLGLTFKAGTDDLRDSPALRLVRLLAAWGAVLSVYDPMATGAAVAQLAAEDVAVDGADGVMAACREADAVLVATEWPEFHEIDWRAAAHAMRGALVFDTRGVIDVDAAVAAGLDVRVLGRRPGVAEREPISHQPLAHH